MISFFYLIHFLIIFLFTYIDVLLVLKYVQNKDVFMIYTKAHLTRRLILGTSADSEKEENMVEWLREVGMPADFINKLSRMFQDIKGKLLCALKTPKYWLIYSFLILHSGHSTIRAIQVVRIAVRLARVLICILDKIYSIY